MRHPMMMAAMAISAALSAAGEGNTCWFPTAGGDLATGWKESETPDAKDRAYLKESGVYTASADVAFGTIWFVGANSLVDLSATPDRKVDLYSCSTYGGINMEQTHYNKAFVSGGVWDFHDTAFYAGPVNKSYGGFEATNAVFKNVGTLYFGEHTHKNVVRLNDTEFGCQSVQAFASCDRNELWIENGSKMSVSGTLATDASGSVAAGNGYNRIFVSGAGSSLAANGSYVYVGQTHPGNAIVVTNGASFTTAGEVRIGEFGPGGSLDFRPVSSNALVFADHATGTVATVQVGRYPGNCGCGLEVRDGSKLSVGRLYVAGGNDCRAERLVVSNALLEVTAQDKDIYLGYASGSLSNEIAVTAGSTVLFTNGGYRTYFAYGDNSSFGRFTARDSTLNLNHFKMGVGDRASSNVFEAVGCDISVDYVHFGNPASASNPVTGTGNRFSATGGKFSIKCAYEDPFGYCSGNAMEIGGTETLWKYAGFNLSRYGTNNLFRLCGGATMDITGGSLCVGDQGGAGNVLEIASGATMKADRLRLYKDGNSLVVSNGVVSVPEGLSTSYNFYGNDAGCRLRIEGSSSEVSVTNGECYVHSDCTLEFAPAAEGLTAVPLTAKRLNVAAGPTLKLEVPADLRAGGDGVVVLAQATDAMSIQPDTLAAARADLPENWVLRLAGNTLYLKRKGGLAVFVR